MENLFEPYFRRKRIDMVKSHIRPDSVVCDMGCGFDGTVLRGLQGHIRKGIGIDKKVSNKKFENIELRKVLVGGRLPKMEKPDCVLMLAVLEHLENPEEILAECRKILKKGGKILLTTPSPKSKYILEFLSILRLVSPEEIRDHKHYFSTKELHSLLLKCGFRNTHIKSFEAGLNTLAVAEK